jgi:hypothetical protein
VKVRERGRGKRGGRGGGEEIEGDREKEEVLYLFLWLPVYCEESVSLSKIEGFDAAGLLPDLVSGEEFTFVIGLVVELFAGDLDAELDFESAGFAGDADLDFAMPVRGYQSKEGLGPGSSLAFDLLILGTTYLATRTSPRY